jgi:hypothetical protein
MNLSRVFDRTASTMAVALLTAGAAAGEGRMSAKDTIAGWPEKPREVAMKLISQYGEPDAVTADRLIWQNKGPWKETIAYREEVPHDFPKPHTDLLEQSINYRVPPDKFDELAEYDGSVIAGRTNGTLAARCDKEEMNFLAINLANDVATGKKSVSEARKLYADTVTAFMKGEKPPYVQKLQFDPPKTATGDRDKPAPGMASAK